MSSILSPLFANTDIVFYWKIMSLPLCAALPCQEVHVLNSVRSRPSVTPVGGAVSLVIAHVRHAMVLDQQTATFVLVGTQLYMGSAPWLTAHWDSTTMVRGTIMMRRNF